MREDIKEDWVAALRSGEYEQANGSLRTRDDKFCCLGVLCDIMAKKGHGCWERDSYAGFWKFVTEAKPMGSGEFLPYDIAQTLGLPGPSVPVCESDLVSMNDSGRSFAEIADIIEDNL